MPKTARQRVEVCQGTEAVNDVYPNALIAQDHSTHIPRMKTQPEIPKYTQSEWGADLEALGHLFSSGQGSPQQVFEYARAKYPASDMPNERAHFLTEAFQFMAVNSGALDAARIVVEGDAGNLASGRLAGALYWWFFAIPWPANAPIPLPDLGAIIKAANQMPERGQKS